MSAKSMEKFIFIAGFLVALLLNVAQGVTYYDYYAPAGQQITAGLVAEGDFFTLNGKEIRIMSGAFHYFRVHPAYWRDTFKKLRASGLNTVETYMPWNLHNPEMGVFDFGDGGRDMSQFLDIRTFIQTAQEEDLFVLLRPGPYICAEWEFGGMPSWILSDYTMHVRTLYKGYIDLVGAYMQAWSGQVVDLSFVKGGPIIGIQIENEYGSFGYGDQPRDKRYLKFINDALISNGLDDVLFYTSDGVLSNKDWGSLPGVFMTANFQDNPNGNLDALELYQPNRPLMVMEFWTGWFDHWTESHSVRVPSAIDGTLDTILSRNSSVNLYMFIGGTNFGFMNGANNRNDLTYQPTVTSYDYDAPLTEAGDYGDKYALFKATFEKHNPLTGIVDHPDPPAERTKMANASFAIQESLDFQALSNQVLVKGTLTDGPVSMEMFSFLNNGNGQSYGYAIYSTTVDLPAGNSTILVRGHVRDLAQVLINGKIVTWPYLSTSDLSGFGFYDGLDESLEFSTPGGPTQIQFMVENLGRVNFGSAHNFYQKKGLWEGPIYVDLQEIKDWEVTPLEFKTTFVNSLAGWEPYTGSYGTPSAYRVTVTITGEPQDAFLDMFTWYKGVVFVNGFNLGRYWKAGPTRTLYVPAPLLVTGDNEFVVFEQYQPAADLVFVDHLILSMY